MASGENNLNRYESWVTLKNERNIFIRPILPTDGPLIVDLFNKLSVHSKYLRFLRHLHTFPEDMLYQFINVNYKSTFALVTLIKENDKDTIIAVARYAYSFSDNLADLGLAVRDDWQNMGIGKTLLKKIIDIGKECSIYRFGSMIEPQNKIIKHILLELNYTVNYSLKNGAYEVEIINQLL
jgi:acetyltransferase